MPANHPGFPNPDGSNPLRHLPPPVFIARAAGQTAGPPAAVKRIMAPSFPLEIDLSTADSMIGQPLPSNVRIKARLDSDGDAMTKNPSDPHAMEGGVATNGGGWGWC